jgi:tetratricopeptide (TPR) repeat protein
MDKAPKAALDKAVQELTASGLILVPYFNAALAKFEEQESSMNVFYKQMILAINPREERERLASVKFSSRAPTTAGQTLPALSEEERLLNQGDNLIYEGRYNEAKTVFQTILGKFNPKSDRALFGLAVVASNTRKPDLAEEYFRKTLDTASDLRLVTWSHIYLGRLNDLQGKRAEALGHYRAASLTAATYPEALRAVQSGLSRPFGSRD